MEKDPPAGFAPASAGLQNRCLAEIGHRGVGWRGKCSRPESHRQPPASQTDVLLLHLGNGMEWCGMPVLPWRSPGGSQTCSLLHQYRGRFEVAGSWERGLVVRPSYPVFFAWTCLGAIRLTVCQGLCRCSGADYKSALRWKRGRQSWNCTGLVASSARCSSV